MTGVGRRKLWNPGIFNIAREQLPTSHPCIFCKMEQSLETMDDSLNVTTGSGWNVSVPLVNNEIYFLIPIMTVIGIIGNSFIVYVIIRGSLTKYHLMILLMTLAIVDNLVICLRLIILAKIIGFFLLPLFICLVNIAMSVCSILSSWLLVLISIERFIAVFFPFKVHIYCSIKTTYISICVFALFALIGCMDALLDCSSYGGNRNSSDFNSTHDARQGSYYQVIIFCILYASLPFLLISVFNISIICKIKSQQAFRNQSQNQRKKTQSLVAVMLSACIIFVLTTFPATTLQMVLSLCEVYYSDMCPQRDTRLIMLLFLLDHINHCVNFFLYCLPGSVFKSAFVRLFKCRCRQASPIISSPAYSITLSEHSV